MHRSALLSCHWNEDFKSRPISLRTVRPLRVGLSQALQEHTLLRRHHRDQSQKPTDLPTASGAFPITAQEMVSLVGVLEHAHTRITELSDTDAETIVRASGAALIPLLYARAGFALTQGIRNIPFLVSEVGLLEAAVINLETYQGNEVVLVAGYEILDALSRREVNSYPLRQRHGILAFADVAGDSTSGSAAPSLM